MRTSFFELAKNEITVSVMSDVCNDNVSELQSQLQSAYKQQYGQYKCMSYASTTAATAKAIAIRQCFDICANTLNYVKKNNN